MPTYPVPLGPLYGLLLIVHWGSCQVYGPLLGLLLSNNTALLAPRAVGRYAIVVGELTMLKIIKGLKACKPIKHCAKRRY